MLTLLVVPLCLAAPPLVSVYCESSASSSRDCRISEGVFDRSATAAAAYNLTLNTSTGFAALDVVSPSTADPSLAAYASGLAEGYQTAAEIALFYVNVYEFGPVGPSEKLTNFVETNDAWVRAQCAKHAASSDYWLSVQQVIDRFDGLLEGYGRAAGKLGLPSLSKLDMLWINLDGDLFDLQGAIGEPAVAGRNGRAARGLWRGAAADNTTERILRCSALFKLAADRSELWFGHATWDTYATAAPRIFKHYTLPSRHDGAVSQRTVSMSSSPGFLASIDDYYLVDQPSTHTTLGVIETSISINDQKAYDAITTQSVLCWIRSMVANQLAVDAPGWAATFSREKSGTYNNQWMIVDVTKAQASTAAGRPLEADSFWVLEEVPGLIHAEDQSAHLNREGFWPSFNEIYYEEARTVAGAHGEYTDAVRFKLFAELQGSVTTDAAMARMIAWNDYQHDAIAKSPSQAIMARGDLSSSGAPTSDALKARSAGGGIDAKYSSVSAAAAGLVSYGRAGPTNDDQPPFCWTAQFAHTPHAGHPHCFDFAWGAFAPATWL